MEPFLCTKRVFCLPSIKCSSTLAMLCETSYITCISRSSGVVLNILANACTYTFTNTNSTRRDLIAHNSYSYIHRIDTIKYMNTLLHASKISLSHGPIFKDVKYFFNNSCSQSQASILIHRHKHIDCNEYRVYT